MMIWSRVWMMKNAIGEKAEIGYLHIKDSRLQHSSHKGLNRSVHDEKNKYRAKKGK